MPFVKHFKTAEKRAAWVEKNSDNIGNLSFADPRPPIEWPEEPMADMDYRRGPSRQANHRSPFGPF